jgi:hypothetical protein
MKFTVLAALLLTNFAFAQAPAPTLSTSDKIAISALEEHKQAAQKTFIEAQQQESAILRESEAAHPGYQLNPQSFAVQPIAKPAPKTEKK